MMDRGGGIRSWPQARDPQRIKDAIETRLGKLPLMAGDRAHLERCLTDLDLVTVADWLQRYATTWRTAAEAERQPERKQNAGRRAANLLLLDLMLERSEGRQ